MLLEGKNLSFGYEKNQPLFEQIQLQIMTGERVGLVAPSGFGKSTLCHILAGYQKPTSGQILVDGKELKEYTYCPVQLIYQHPEKAVNPKWNMKAILQEGDEISDRVIHRLGIKEEWMTRFPHELSGGELQRFCVARAMGKQTKFIVADEISTMLDPITQAVLWEFLLEEVEARQLGLLVVTHNRHLLEKVCTRIIDFEKLGN